LIYSWRPLLNFPKKIMSDTPKSQSWLQQTGERVIASIDAVETDPKAMVRASIRRVAALHYPTPVQETQADILIASIEPDTRELIGQPNLPALRKLLYQFEQDAQRLTAPIPELTWEEHLHRWPLSNQERDRLWQPVNSQTDRIKRVDDDVMKKRDFESSGATNRAVDHFREFSAA
jgi:hypothetical protein